MSDLSPSYELRTLTCTVIDGVTFNKHNNSLEFSANEKWYTIPGVDAGSVTLVPDIGIKLNGRVYVPKKNESGNIAYSGLNPFGPWGDGGKMTNPRVDHIIWNKLVCVHRVSTIIHGSLNVTEYCAQFNYDEAELQRGFKKFIMLESVPVGDGGKAESDDDDCFIVTVSEDGPAKKRAKRQALGGGGSAPVPVSKSAEDIVDLSGDGSAPVPVSKSAEDIVDLSRDDE